MKLSLPIIIVLLSCISIACTTKTTTTTTYTWGAPHDFTKEERAERVLTHQDIRILHKLNQKTLGKIRKGHVLDCNDVIAMQESAIQSDTIIQVLVLTQSKFDLSTAEIVTLQKKGVPFKVINFMMRT